MTNEQLDAIAALTKSLLKELGEDSTREGLHKTPARVAKAWEYFVSGYSQDPHEIVNNALFDAESDGLIAVTNIDFFSMCEHHLLPFFGTIDVAYLPSTKVIGISKIPRIVELFARRLQLQENITHQIADFFYDLLKPRGLGIVCAASHACVMMRGIQKVNTRTITTATRGNFEESREAMDWLHGIHAFVKK